jgi:hypothetical protein
MRARALSSAFLTSLLLSVPALVSAAEVCAGKAGSVAIASVHSEGGMVDIAGTWKASPGTQGLGIEVRIDQDRQKVELHTGEGGAWAVKVPFALCGRHALRIYAFAAVPEGDHTTLCFEGAPSALNHFEVDCSPQAKLDRCVFDCPKPKPVPAKKGKAAPPPAPPAPVECKATCDASGASGVGTLAGLAGLNNANFQMVEGPGGGPWTFTLPCKPGDKVTFIVRDHSGVGATSKPAERECGPQ